MPKKNLPEYKRFTITSQRDPKTGSYEIPDYEKDLRSYVNNALKSALPKDAFFYVKDKEIAKSGRQQVDVFVHKEDAKVVRQSFETETDRHHFRGSADPKYKVTKPRPLTDEQTKAIYEEEKSKQEGKETETQRFNKGTFLKILGVVTSLVAIVRRILSTMSAYWAQTTKDMVTAHNLGLSYETVREYRHTEAAHGMKEGSLTEAVKDVQTKFGNITSLDEKALEALAVVMGGKIEEMATLGLGSSNPEKILASILDTFNEKANAGYNSVGQYVGEQQARRELYSYLLKISPQWADIFATMQEEQHNINSLFRGQAETFEQWKNLVPTSRGNNTPMHYNVTATLGKEWDIVKDIFKQWKEGMVVSLSPDILTLLRKIADTRVGMSETEKRERNKENTEANQRALTQLNKDIKNYEANWSISTPEEKAYLQALKQYKTELEKALKGDWNKNIPYAVRTPEELRAIAIGIIRQGVAKESSYNLKYSKDEFTVDELREVAESYSFDLDKERKQYEEIRKKHNKKLGDEKIKEAKDANALYRKAAEDYDKASRNKKSDEYVKGNASDKAQLRLLGIIRRLYPDADFRYDEKGNKRDVSEQLRLAVAAKYLVPSGNMGELAIPMPSYAGKYDEDAIRAQVEEENPFNEAAFLYWLYSKNAKFFNEKIFGARGDEAIANSITGVPEASIQALGTTVGTKNYWGAKIPKTYAGGGVAIGVNDTSNGEVVHKIILDVKNDGVDSGDIELGSFLGMTGYVGTIGEVKVTSENGKTDYTISQGTSASAQK